MKLTEKQKQEKIAFSNIKKLVNRVSSEFSFKKWRNYRGYLYSIGIDSSVVNSTPDKELTREELDELLKKYEDDAIKTFRPDARAVDVLEHVSTSKSETNGQVSPAILSAVSKAEEQFNKTEEKFTEKNNYGLSKSPKESVTLFWFQRKAAAEILKGFEI